MKRDAKKEAFFTGNGLQPENESPRWLTFGKSFPANLYTPSFRRRSLQFRHGFYTSRVAVRASLAPWNRRSVKFQNLPNTTYSLIWF